MFAELFSQTNPLSAWFPPLHHLQRQMKCTVFIAVLAMIVAIAAAQATFPAFVEAEPVQSAVTIQTAAPGATTAPLSEDEKLDAALNAIGEDIIAKSKQIKNEETWVEEVKKIIKLYTKKLQRVVANVKQLREDVRKLYIKKRQIQNLKIQRALEKRMEEAKADLNTLDSKLSVVKQRSDEFARTRKGIEQTVKSLESKLAELRGKPAAATAAPKKF